MDSQQDMFATQETPKSKVNYGYLVLCDKTEGALNPFSLFPTSMFSNKEICEKWLSSTLDHSSRLRTLYTLDGLVPEKSFCLFGKIAEGEVRQKKYNFLAILKYLIFKSILKFRH